MKIAHTEQMERLGQLKIYKRTIASRYRCILNNELDELLEGKYRVSPKVDGELWFINVTSKGVSLIAHNGDILIAGELFALAKKGRPRVGDVAHALSLKGDPKKVGFQAFDLLIYEGEEPSADYAERYGILETILEGGERVKAIKTMEASRSDIAEIYQDLVVSGKAEGLVARAEDGRIFKIKPAFHIDCAVVGYTQSRKKSNQVLSLLLGLERPDGTIQIIGSCGNLGDGKRSKDLYEALSKTTVDSQFRKVSSSGALYQLCKPSIVVEIVCSDVQSDDSRGDPIRQWALGLDSENGWTALAPVNGASLLHPRMERVRDDKNPSGTDIRVAQLNERCMAQGLEDGVEKVELPKSNVVRREVYTKTVKGSLAVRKLLVWETNKATVHSAYPAYVINFTDYSPARASPIKREVRLAPNAETAEAIANAIIVDNVKSGWVRA
jgi:hypothetical protein